MSPKAAARFRAGTVDVFDSNFKLAALAGSFSDSTLPTGYAPFGIALIDGNLFVTYAKQDAMKHDDVKGAGQSSSGRERTGLVASHYRKQNPPSDRFPGFLRFAALQLQRHPELCPMTK
jgi:hypothetical protein